MKNVPKGLNHYRIMRGTSFYPEQKKVTFTENLPFGDLCPYGFLEFDPKAKSGRLQRVFRPSNVNKGEPTFMLHQCNPKVWVLKRNYSDETPAQVCALFNKWIRMGTKFTCWRWVVCAGEDSVLVSLVAHCIDSFLLVAKGQNWSLHHGQSAQDFDWPQLP